MSQVPVVALAPEYQRNIVLPASPRCATRCLPKCEPKCPPKKEMCKDPCGAYDWSWLAGLVLWFIAFVVIFWLIFYSLKPAFVLQSGTNQVDTAKVLLSAVIAAIILIIILWLIKFAVTRKW